MTKNRIAYALVTVFALILLMGTSSSLFLMMLLFLLGFAALMAGFLLWDMRHLYAELVLVPGSAGGESLQVLFRLHASVALHAARFVRVCFVIENQMFGMVEQREETFELAGKETVFELEAGKQLCGEVRVRCESVMVFDLLRLFSGKLTLPEERRTILYPRQMSVQVEMSGMLYGNNKEDGRIQNRRGKDKSEIFDLREYVPGDDLRSIHWKLSEKTGKLIVKEASDPTHYQIALLPDFGRMQDNAPVPKAELKAAAAMTAALGEELLALGICFGFFMPSERGLTLREIRKRQEFEQVLAEWLGIRVQEKCGIGLTYFKMNHMEQYCSRLILIDTGRYTPQLSWLKGTIGITQISLVSDAADIVTDEDKGYSWIEVPAELSGSQTCHIVC